MRLEEDVLVVDSLVSYSSGPVRVSGELDVRRLSEPRFDLTVEARDTRIDYRTETGFLWRATWRPRFLPAVPTLAREPPDRTSVLGAFLFREWRF